MASVWLWTLGSVIIVSLISFIGVVTLSMSKSLLHKALIIMVSFSAGAMLGNVFIHLLPEHIEKFGMGTKTALLIILGMLIFFILEKFINWHHCHAPHHEHAEKHHIAVFGITNLVGDAMHNFIDGLVIAASYLISIPVGIATTTAVILHEIPQEIGDFGVLLHAGLDKRKALLLNFATALTSIIGAVVGLMLALRFDGFIEYMVPITAGSFIYIATADIIPELHKEVEISQSFVQLIGITAGIGMMLALLFLEL